MKLRSYRTPGRAETYAKTLRRRFPDAVFTVVQLPFLGYAFRFLIKVAQAGRGIVGGDGYMGL
jgi:hypothetical protein